MVSELENLIVHPSDFLDDEEREFHERFNIYPVDATRVAIAEHVMAKFPADLDLVYLWGVDPTQHYFWKYFEPERWPGPAPSSGEIFMNRNRIPDYYRDTDAFLARLLRDVGENDTVVIEIPDRTHGPRFLRGDCNGDGNVTGTVADAVFLLQFNFLGGTRPSCMAACDANGDGDVGGQVGDSIYILTFNFLGGPPPPQPFPECGTSDLEADTALRCVETSKSCP